MHHLDLCAKICGAPIALRRAYERGATDVDAALLGEVADLMILRRDEITQADDILPDDLGPEREVG
jgi:hypothetical protein